VLAGLEKGRGLPTWVEDAPPVRRAEEFFLRSFWKLSTCRALGFGSVGPIPWTAVVEFADRKCLERDVAELFEDVIGRLDNDYRDWVEAEWKKK